MAVATYTKTGNKATSPAKLDKSVFKVNIKNSELIKLAYVSYLSNKRASSATTKTRGLVRGGGRKPWRQKGTGRARFGSSRNPIWRGGGIVFGPDGTENYKKKLPIKAKKQALRQALTLAAETKKFLIIEDIVASKTNEVAKLLNKISTERNTIIIDNNIDPKLKNACANLASVDLVSAKRVAVFDVINADTVIVTNAGLTEINNRLATIKEAK